MGRSVLKVRSVADERCAITPCASMQQLYRPRYRRNSRLTADLPVCDAAWNRLIASGEEVTFDYRLQRASDSAWRWQIGHGAGRELGLWRRDSPDLYEHRRA
jgi:hypothetical protein